uniref:Uncharacterized protein n=1 Tax=Timema bartmani TaxID=61472 RepID=A0A7R9HZW8_9NEOP|nr:unnamed protein product [Timema bartmani]
MEPYDISCVKEETIEFIKIEPQNDDKMYMDEKPWIKVKDESDTLDFEEVMVKTETKFYDSSLETMESTPSYYNPEIQAQEVIVWHMEGEQDVNQKIVLNMRNQRDIVVDMERVKNVNWKIVPGVLVQGAIVWIMEGEQNNTVRTNVAFIAANYSASTDVIKCLEERNKSLVNSLDVVDDVVEKIQGVPGVAGKTVQEKSAALCGLKQPADPLCLATRGEWAASYAPIHTIHTHTLVSQLHS